MNVQSIEIMGPEYVVMLGVWWGVAVFLTFAILTARRAYIYWRQRQDTVRVPAVVNNQVDA